MAHTTRRKNEKAAEEMTFHCFRVMASTLLNELGYNRDGRAPAYPL
ncbi:MAG: hypothetical protein LBS77_01840 [Desulfovibrio sp.]|jgi:hypothetical protein|nr:hypothetical protein [Desulfovibrio sp.]